MTINRADALKAERLLREIEKRKTFRKIDFFVPYTKQQEFFDLGASKRERLFMAGNQLGKTEAGAAEASYHLTGEYPDEWLGRRWERPTKGWIAGVTSLAVRDVQQKKLCGEPGVEAMFGSGLIPKDRFVDKPSLSRGITDAYDTIQVRHKSGGISIGRFKSYEQGRAKFQGETLDWFWDDEEPDLDIYSEQLTRITATGGMGFITFTPLRGLTEVVMRFLNEKSEDRGVVQMTIDDALHIPAADRAKIIAGYPEYEREARANGTPMLGSGRIFQISEANIKCDPFTTPPHWSYLWAVDFGTGHPFAAVLLAWDKDNDVIYVVHAIRMKDALPIQHVAAMRPRGLQVPVAWPQDGHQREEFDGKLAPLAKIYANYGAKMLGHHATFEDGSNSTEIGILQMEERFKTSRLKVFSTLTDWFEEYRIYHRKDGEIVKIKDDLMSATRVGIMAKRFAKPVFWHPDGSNNVKIAEGVDCDPWNP
jgi:phage terminase large subunit-like protein